MEKKVITFEEAMDNYFEANPEYGPSNNNEGDDENRCFSQIIEFAHEHDCLVDSDGEIL